MAARAVEVEQAFAVARRAFGGNGNGFAPREVFAGERFRVRGDFCGRAFGDDAPAVDARAGTDIDDVIGSADGVFVVLNDDDGVAQIAQAQEAIQQAGVVALVQTDRRLIENVHHADQPGADL